MASVQKQFEILRNSAIGTSVVTLTFSQAFQSVYVSAGADVYISFNKDAGDTGAVWTSNQGNVYHVFSTGNRQSEAFDFKKGQIISVQVQSVSSTTDVSVMGISG